jgi:hypothetical protein
MQIEVRRRFPIEPLEKREEVLCAMPRVTLADGDPVEQPHGRK